MEDSEVTRAESEEVKSVKMQPVSGIMANVLHFTRAVGDYQNHRQQIWQKFSQW